MSRLTTKDGKYADYNIQNGVCYGIKRYENALTHKLSELEDLEEEIGCPLEVLFRALKEGIYHNEKFEHPTLILDEDSFKKNNLSLLVVGTIVYLKDYKKTWWLKEDRSE